MSIDVTVTFVTPLPHSLGEVVYGDVHLVVSENPGAARLIFSDDEVEECAGASQHLAIFLNPLVVIPEQECVPAIQLSQVVHPFIERDPTPDEVSDVNRQDASAVRNLAVVIRDKRVLHLVEIFERTFGEMDDSTLTSPACQCIARPVSDVFVARDEELRHFFRSAFVDVTRVYCKGLVTVNV